MKIGIKQRKNCLIDEEKLFFPIGMQTGFK